MMLTVCVNRHSSATYIAQRAQEVLTAWRVQAAEVCVDMAWRIVAFDLASCTLGD